MNVIAGLQAYSLYPYLTFLHKAGVTLEQREEQDSLPSSVTAPLDKVLELRGYRSIEGHGLGREFGAAPAEVTEGRRFCGDRHCFVLSWWSDPWPVRALDFPRLRHNSWNLVIHPRSKSRPWYRSEYEDEGSGRSTGSGWCTVGFNTTDAFEDVGAFTDMGSWGRNQAPGLDNHGN